MAIQNRRGIFSDLDPTKLLPGEYAVVISGDPDNTDGNGVYICFAPGQVKKIALTEDMSLDGKIYPDLTAGDVLADTYAENKVPYFFRQSGGGAEVGTIEAPVLVGGSVGWNQLVQNGNFADGANEWRGLGNATFTVSNGECEITPVARYDGIQQTHTAWLVSGHRYLILATAKGSVANIPFQFGLGDNVAFTIGVNATLGTSYQTYRDILTTPTVNMSSNHTLYARTNASSNFAKYTVKDIWCIDLTLLLGSTVADRIYTLEQSTAGSGIAQLKAWGFDFGEYIPYSAPTLKHVEGVSAHKFVGFNQWDNQTSLADNGFTEQSDGSWYLANLGNVALDTLMWENKSGYTGQIYFQYSYKNVNGTGSQGGRFKWVYSDGTTDTIYADVTTSFTQRTNLSLANKTVVGLAWDYGSAINSTWLKNVVVNFSSSRNGTYEPYRTWSYALDGGVIIRGVPKLDANNQLYYDGDTYEPDGTVTRNCAVRAYQSGDESLADAITDGTNTVYKLSTPTTETAEPYTEYQDVDANGTEEYVSTGVVPVGHTTKYPTDIKGAFESILSAIPSANGTYALKVTVANGKKTFSWV